MEELEIIRVKLVLLKAADSEELVIYHLIIFTRRVRLLPTVEFICVSVMSVTTEDADTHLNLKAPFPIFL